MIRLQFAPPARAQRGVALVESLMALLIFSVGLLGLLGLEARVMNFSSESENRNRAAMFASEVSSQMWLNGTVRARSPSKRRREDAWDWSSHTLPEERARH